MLSSPSEPNRQLDCSRNIGSGWVAEPGRAGGAKDRSKQVATHSPVLKILDLQLPAVRAYVSARERVKANAAVGVSRRSHQAQHIIAVEQKEQRPVEDVEDVRLELKAHLLADWECLTEGNIKAVVGITVARVANQVPVDELEINQIAGETVDRSARVRVCRRKERCLRAVANRAASLAHQEIAAERRSNVR